jgi:hypothetical protein
MSILKKLTRLFRRATPRTEHLNLQNAADLDDLRRKSVRTQREEKILWVVDACRRDTRRIPEPARPAGQRIAPSSAPVQR